MTQTRTLYKFKNEYTVQLKISIARTDNLHFMRNNNQPVKTCNSAQASLAYEGPLFFVLGEKIGGMSYTNCSYFVLPCYLW
jgi:hypothetical protein